jgi:hypothetical protein
MLNSVTPLFIVDDLEATVEFYSRLGFNVLHTGGDGLGKNFWAMVGRDQVMLMFKHIAPEVHPQPNRSRHEWAAWDAYIFTSDARLAIRRVRCQKRSHAAETGRHE